MSENKKRIVIIGAGPIGCYAAQLLKQQGIDTLLIEEHKEVGVPVHCAGVVGKGVFQKSRIDIPKNIILNELHGARVHLNGDHFDIERERVAYVVDRERFDKHMSVGLNIQLGTKCIGIERDSLNGEYIIATDQGDIRAEKVIGADGAASVVRTYLYGRSRVKLRGGVQFRIIRKPKFRQKVEIFVLGNHFFWIIPETDNVIRVGGISDKPYYNLIRFLEDNGISGQILSKYGGVVPMGNICAGRDNIFLVGDSGCQIKPMTYGGIYYGMRGAEILAECLISGKERFYPRYLAKSIGREIKVGLRAKQIFEGIGDNDKSRLFSVLKSNRRFIENRGNFECHSFLLERFLRNIALLVQLKAVIKRTIKKYM